MSIKRFFPTTRPTLDLNFAATKRLDPRITFTRASTGIFVGSDGLIKTAANNAPRFDHDPFTGESLGLLVEEARTNLVQYSQDITDAAWFKSNATVTKETLTGPAGTVPYDKIILGTFTGSSGGTSRNPISTSPSVFYTASIYAKAGTCRYIGLVSSGYDSNGWGTYFDLEAGVVTQNRGSTAYSILSVGNGWYRLSIGRDVGTGGSNPGFSLIPLTVAIPTNGPSNNIQPQYDGNGEYLYAWAPQFEAGAFPTSYIPTVASAVTRAADVASFTGADFSSWYSQGQGTIFVNYINRNVSKAYAVASLGATNNEIRVVNNANDAYIINLGAIQYSQGTTADVFLKRLKRVLAYETNNVNLAMNGTLYSLNTSATIPIVNEMTIAPANTTPGVISRITYWPVRLPDATLQAITQ